MSAAWSAAGDFDPHLCGIMRATGALLGQAREAMHGMSGPGESIKDQGSRGPGRRGGPWARRAGPWERGFGFPSPGGWPGGPAGSAGGFSGGSRGWWPGPPGPARGPKAGRGDVRAAILALLREGPRNGYQIMSEIEERSGGAWRPSPGAVYPALQLLADEGLIAGE
ncbi:MAG: PadR family transcriptional regulator, partial [Streptosporangiaceae bacterium]